jgi:hypothetical protein
MRAKYQLLGTQLVPKWERYLSNGCKKVLDLVDFITDRSRTGFVRSGTERVTENQIFCFFGH